MIQNEPRKVYRQGAISESKRDTEIEPSGFQQNVRLEILKLALQEQNLGQPRF